MFWPVLRRNLTNSVTATLVQNTFAGRCLRTMIETPVDRNRPLRHHIVIRVHTLRLVDAQPVFEHPKYPGTARMALYTSGRVSSRSNAFLVFVGVLPLGEVADVNGCGGSMRSDYSRASQMENRAGEGRLQFVLEFSDFLTNLNPSAIRPAPQSA